MLKYTCLVVALMMPVSAAVAEDWAGQGPPVLPSGSLGTYPEPGFASITTSKIVVACCTNAGQPYYTPDFSTAQPLTVLPGNVTAQNTLNINVIGAYADPLSGTGLSTITANIPLSAFARSSTVDDLASQFSAQVNQMQQQLMMQDKMALQGVASAIAMAGGADLASDENYAVSGNWGTFGGQNAFAGSFAMRAADHLTFSAGVAASVSGGPVGARAGFRFAW